MAHNNAQSIFESVVETRGVEGVFEISADGFIIRSLQSRSSDPEAVAAAIASTMKAWKKIGNDLRMGNCSWVLLEYRYGKVVVAHYGSTILVITGSQHMVYGELLMKINSSGTR